MSWELKIFSDCKHYKQFSCFLAKIINAVYKGKCLMLCLWSGPAGYSCLISFAQIFSCISTVEYLFLTLSPFNILIIMYLEMLHQWVRGILCEPNIYVSWSTSELRVRMVQLNMFKRSSVFLLTIPRRCFLSRYILLFMFHICIC